jgi:hypothetical protein
MQSVEPDVERYLDTAHDGRLDFIKNDLETGDGCGHNRFLNQLTVLPFPWQQFG